jgi:hypothetical protein
VKLEAARTATEDRARTAVVAGDMPTGATGLRGMPGINPDHRATLFFGLVLDKRAQLGERPAVDTARLLPLPLPDPTSDLGQVLDGNRRTSRRRLHHLLRQHVVTVAAEAALPALQLLEVAFGRLRARLLEFTLQAKPAGFNLPPTTLAEELRGARHCRLCQSEVNAHNSSGRGDFGSRHIQHHMEEPSPLPAEQVGRADLAATILCSLGRQREGDSGSSGGGRETDLARCPRELEGVDVEARRAGPALGTGNLVPFLGQSQRGLHSSGCLDTGLNVEVRDQVGQLRLQWIVGLVVEANAVLLSLLPAHAADVVKRLRELVGGPGKGLRLLGSRVKLQTNSSIHTNSIPYTASFAAQRGANSRPA